MLNYIGVSCKELYESLVKLNGEIGLYAVSWREEDRSKFGNKPYHKQLSLQCDADRLCDFMIYNNIDLECFGEKQYGFSAEIDGVTMALFYLED